MGTLPPPPPPYGYVAERIAHGARTIEQIDPDFAEWHARSRRSLSRRAAFVAGACVGLLMAGLALLVSMLAR